MSDDARVGDAVERRREKLADIVGDTGVDRGRIVSVLPGGRYLVRIDGWGEVDVAGSDLSRVACGAVEHHFTCSPCPGCGDPHCIDGCPDCGYGIDGHFPRTRGGGCC